MGGRWQWRRGVRAFAAIGSVMAACRRDSRNALAVDAAEEQMQRIERQAGVLERTLTSWESP